MDINSICSLSKTRKSISNHQRLQIIMQIQWNKLNTCNSQKAHKAKKNLYYFPWQPNDKGRKERKAYPKSNSVAKHCRHIKIENLQHGIRIAEFAKQRKEEALYFSRIHNINWTRNRIMFKGTESAEAYVDQWIWV